jgi:nitrite reductase/ring-hydroxylating ferredoxin subunit
MRTVRVGSLAQLPPGEVMEALIDDQPYAICNYAGEIHALGGVCPHSGGPLGQGAMTKQFLHCPWHGWAFDCRTGAFDYNGRMSVPKYPVQISGDEILIEIP